MINEIKKNQKGISLLLAIVVVGALSLVLVKSLSILSLSNLNLAVVQKNGEIAKANASSCREEVLRYLVADNDWQGSINLNLNQGTCSANLVNNEEINISTSGTYDKYNYSSDIILNLQNGRITKKYEQ